MTLLERDQPLAALSHALAASCVQGQVAAVSGEAGVGKTALLGALAAREPASTAFIWGACEALSTARPLGPLLDMAPDLGTDFEALLAATAPRHQVFAAFATCVARRAPPTVVVFEDVHWADEATVDLLRYVGRRLHRIRALIVITWRADEVGADHPLHLVLGELPSMSTHHIGLEPLSLAAVSRMAGDTRDPQAIYALTSGNPFFVTEIVRAAGEGVPASVRAAMLARRISLSAEARQVVDFVSVVPGRAEIDMVRASVTPDTEILMQAVDVGLLTFDGRALGFRHELARLAVLESLPLLRVQELHHLVHRSLAAFSDRAGVLARLVHHAVGAGDGDAVQHFAPAAARQAASLGAHREAAAHYRTAIAWSGSSSTRAELVELLAYEYYLTGDIEAARKARTEALEWWRELAVPKAVGRNVRWLSRLAWFLGDYAEARRRAMEAIEVLSPLGEDEELAMALSNRAQLHMLAHESESCIVLGERAIDMARRIGSIEVLSHALNNVGSVRAYADDLSGRRLQEESLALALDHDLHEHAARAFTNLSSCSIHGRDYAYARRWLDRGINYSLERDLDSWRLYMLAWRARLLSETGRWAEAEADCATVIGSPRTAPVARIPALVALGLLRARQGSPDAAGLLDQALTLALPTAESQRLVPVHGARAEHALLEGRLDAARAEAEAGLALVGPANHFWDRDYLRYQIWRADGGKDGGKDAPHREGNAGITPSSPHGTSLLGDWRGAAEAWQRLDCPYERAEALADGDIPAMEEALETFLALGAAPAADRVRQGLRREGVMRLRRGPRSSTRAHPAGLTRRESEILELLARHLSNPAIGDRLFVSPKTVEHHVSAILAKLDVTTRDQAVAEARRRGWIEELAGERAK